MYTTPIKSTLTAIALVVGLAASAAHADALNDYLMRGTVTPAPAHRSCGAFSAETLDLMGATPTDVALFRSAGCKIPQGYRPINHESVCTFAGASMTCRGD